MLKRLLNQKVEAETWVLFNENLTRYAALYGNIQIIGSGGNINKLCKLAPHSKKNQGLLSLSELNRLYYLLAPMTLDERKATYGLKDDRADVIVPAAEIFLKACQCLQCHNIVAPNISLADSIVDGLIGSS